MLMKCLTGLNQICGCSLLSLRPYRVFVHAGVVGWKGKAIVIPGRSHSGQSTMVAELVRAGASYYSDEYAVFDYRGRVHPFPKDLELRDCGAFRQTRFGVETFGGQTARKPIPVGLMMETPAGFSLNQPSTLNQSSNGGDLLVISHKNFAGHGSCSAIRR
jgi:hypothetical protein